MEVLAPPTLPQRTSSLFDGRRLWWPGAGPNPLTEQRRSSSRETFGPQAPPSPPEEMSDNKLSLPPISDLLACSSQNQAQSSGECFPQCSFSLPIDVSNTESPDQRKYDSLKRTDQSPHNRTQAFSNQSSPVVRYPPTPPNNSYAPREQPMQPPLIMQPKHDPQRIDPALFDGTRQRTYSQTSGSASRPTVDTSSYPPYPSILSATTPYPHSAPVHHTQSQYGDISPRSAISAAPRPYYSTPQLPTPQAMSAPALPDPRRYSTEIPYLSQPAQGHPPHHDDPGRRQILPHNPSLPSQPPRGGFHPYDPRIHHRRSSQASDTQARHPTGSESPLSNSQSAAGRNIAGRAYVCESCSKEFSRPSSLKIHEHSHTGEKPYICPRAGCEKAFSVRSNMKRHERGCRGLGLGPIASLPEEPEVSEEH